MLHRARAFFSGFEKKYALSPDLLKRPLYEGKPSWWIKFSLPAAGCGLFMGCVCHASRQRDVLTADAHSFTMAELTWREWSLPKDQMPEGADPNERVLRPAWQRGGLAFFHVACSLCLAAVAVGASSQNVRRLSVIPRGVAPHLGGNGHRLFVQGVLDLKGGGIVPFERARLFPGRDNTEVVLRIDGKRGMWRIGTKNATCNGEEGSPEKIREGLMSAWGFKKGDVVGLGRGGHLPVFSDGVKALGAVAKAPAPAKSMCMLPSYVFRDSELTMR
jgi:hypothetical protein